MSAATDASAAAYLAGVPALTLQNPWGHLIAHYGKDVENRSWKPWPGVSRFLVHAGASWDKAARDWVRPLADIGDPHISAIVAVADIAEVCEESRSATTWRCGCGDWAMPDRYHWRLTRVITLPEPVSCPGRQGLWRPSPEVVAAVAAQLVNNQSTKETTR